MECEVKSSKNGKNGAELDVKEEIWQEEQRKDNGILPVNMLRVDSGLLRFLGRLKIDWREDLASLYGMEKLEVRICRKIRLAVGLSSQSRC